MLDDLGKPAPRVAPVRPVEALILVVLTLALLGDVLDFRRDARLEQVQADGIVRGYLNRAATCDLSKAIGSDEPSACDDPAIAPYRDPDLVPNSTAGARSSAKTHELVCALLAGSTMPNVRQVHDDLCIAG